MMNSIHEDVAHGRGLSDIPRNAARPSRPCRAFWLPVVAIAMLSACEQQRSETAPVPVMARVLAPEKVSVSRRYGGSVEPLQATSLAFKLSGTVRSLYRPPGFDRDVQVGDTLAKGTVIAELDEGDLRRARTGAEARVALLEARSATARETLAITTRNLERFDNSAGSVSKVASDEVRTRRVATAGELEAAEHALADARVQLDQAIDDYENRRLIVPFDRATVAAKSIEPGERKAAHEVAFRLIDISTVYVNFGVPDTMLGAPAIASLVPERIAMGQQLSVTADALEGRVLTASVTKIAPEADPTTRTFLVQLTLPNSAMDGRLTSPSIAPALQRMEPGSTAERRLDGGLPVLRPGMIVSVIVGAQRDRAALLLPMSAIHEGGPAGGLMVYEIVGANGRGFAKRRRVALGGVFDNQVEVLASGSEVGPGARIVVTTSERLSDGLRVRVMPEESTERGAMAMGAR